MKKKNSYQIVRMLVQNRSRKKIKVKHYWRKNICGEGKLTMKNATEKVAWGRISKEKPRNYEAWNYYLWVMQYWKI